MYKGNIKKRIGLVVLACLVTLAPVGHISASALKEAEQEKEELETSLKEAQKLIDHLKGSKENIEDKVTELDGRLTQISGNIEELALQLEVKNTELADNQAILEEAQQDEKRQYERMKIRIRYMYENGQNSCLQSFLTAENFTDFLNAVEYIRQISQYDRDMLEQYCQTQNLIAETQVKLETDRAELEQMQAQVKDEEEAVQALLTAKETELASVDKNLHEANDLADVFAAEIQAQEDIIAQIQQAEAAKKAAAEAEAKRKAEEEARRKAEEEARKKAEEAAQQEENSEVSTEESSTETGQETENPQGTETEVPTDTYNGGAFTWPCPSSRRITSDYGNRVSPTAGASSNHKGIDIGADYGADIVAAAEGTVVFAGYSSAAGNYVMLDHGGSLYTVYMHASSLCVANGDTVTGGQVIAKVGSTGVSTGNHLHFGVSLNGSYVSPWNYLSR